MSRKKSDQFDPTQRYTSSRQQQGPVQQDSDWNKPPRKGRPRSLARKAFLLILAAAILLAAAGFLLMYFGNVVINPVRNGTLVVLTNPANGTILPLHGTYSVRGEAASRQGLRELQLMVNGQPWGSQAYEAALPAVQHTWAWTPSGEGTHELFVRAIDAAGRVQESNHVRVMALSKADARFPLQYAAEAGDTLDSLSQRLGSSPEEILEANPGLDPQSPLSAGQPLLIPVHVPNAEPAAPEGGAPAAPPVEPPPDASENPLAVIDAGINLVTNGGAPAESPGFLLANGKLIPEQPVDKLYLYISLNGEIPWWRIPEDPTAFLSPTVGGFELAPYLNLAQLEASPQPVTLDAEAWGWQGGTLIFLGNYHGTLGGGLRAWPPNDTRLQIVEYEALGVPQHTFETNLVGENPTLEVDFDWSTTSPTATHGRWQVSTEPFSENLNVFPGGLVHQGTVKASQESFEINFNQYFEAESFWDEVGSGLDGMENFLEGQEEPSRTFWKWMPATFYVRIIPLKTTGAFSLEPAGTASNMVIVRYLPTGKVLPDSVPPGGPVYQARIVEFVQYRSADPAYQACTVLSKDFLVDGKVVIASGTQACGCPGAPCGGGSSCSADPSDWGTCATDAIEAGVNGLTELLGMAADLYNDAKQFVVDTLGDGICEGIMADTMPESTCRALVEAGVNIGLAAMGLPPEIPNINALMNEGLEYAVASLAAQFTGFECDKTCRDLLKQAYEGASNPEQLYDKGLLYGATLAAGKLADMDIDCDAECQGIIKDGLQGDINLGGLTDEALAALAQEAAQKLKAKGLQCDPLCEAAILQAYKDGNNLGKSVADSASQVPASPIWQPHPLALEQPPIAKVEIFRRFESAEYNEETIAERCTGFTIDNSAANNSYSMPLSGRVFEPRGVDMPLIEPGGSVLVPIVLRGSSWNLPAGFSDGVNSEILGYQSAGTEDGQQLGQVQQGQTVSFQSQWRVLYHGSQLTLRVFGPFMMDVIDGKGISVPCFGEDTETYYIPMP